MLPSVNDALCPWNSPECTGINRLSGRASIWPYPSAEAARAQRDCPRMCLDGQWDFAFFNSPQQVPSDVVSAPEKQRWDSLPVPGLWTMHGYDRPQYSNWRIPFTPVHSPQVPQDNPVGIYHTTFQLPRDWRHKRVVLHYAGIEAGCVMIWLNGHSVGLGKDSRLPSEFELSKYLRSGRNSLQVHCLKWSDSTYIEDQDHWRQYGINRSVYVYVTDETFIEDFAASGDWDPATGRGQLRSELRLGGVGGAGWRYRLRLYDPRGREVKSAAREEAIPWGLTCHNRPREPIADINVRLPRVHPWSHETPTLYQVSAELLNPQGQVMEATACRVGFRRVEIVNRELRLNGRMVYIKGVNRHDHHDTTGKVIDRETMLADLRVMKAHHINAIRCSHYPNDPLFYELCDELGFLLIDECNIESHHTYARTAHDPRYAAAFLDRAMRMVQRDRNHPCIIAWSLGNESGYGPNHDAMAGWIRHVDPSRLVHYEGAICRANSHWGAGHRATDIISPMYPEISDIVAWAQDNDDPRPLIMSEYSHAMGNSNGSLADYWEAIRSNHGLQGGFIWEWIDHGLRQRGPQGEPYWAYGGDFGDEPNDADFVCDGLVWPDRRPHPAMREVFRLFQPLSGALRRNRGKLAVDIRSEYDFISCAHLRGRWEVLVDGNTVASGALPRLRLQPGESSSLEIPTTLPQGPAGAEAQLRLHWVDTRDCPLGGRNTAAAWLQFPLSLAAAKLAPTPPTAPAYPALQLESSPDGLRIYSSQVELRLRHDGQVEGWRVAGELLLQGGPEPTWWRGPLENEGVRAWDFHAADDQPAQAGEKPLRRWSRQGLDTAQIQRGELRCRRLKDGRVQLRQQLRLQGRDPQLAVVEERVMWLHRDGSLSCEHRFQVPKGLADLPRLGLCWQGVAAQQEMEWLGHGPEESYRDRCLGTPLGRYSSSIAERYVPYIMPQEHGNIAGLRWLALRNSQGRGFMLSAEGIVEGKATFYDDAQLTAARHTYDIAPKAAPYLYVDVAQRGLGTGSCGPDTLPQYRLPSGRMRLAYRLVPLESGDDPGLRHRQG